MDARMVRGKGWMMVVLIIGGGSLLEVLKSSVPERRWRVPAGDRADEQAEFLTRNPVPPGKHGIVLTTEAANWLNVARAGWSVYWCAPSQMPVGTRALPDSYMSGSVAEMAYGLWRLNVPDKRLVIDVMNGNMRTSATLLMVTSNTGGVGKTVTCRRLAERAAAQRIPTLLVDGNVRQSSQRSFFDPAQTLPLRTIADWRPGDKPQHGATHGRQFNVGYDIAFAPPTGVDVTWDTYRKYIEQARRLWQFVIVDLDRISAGDLNDPDTAAGSLVVPYVTSGDLCLVVVKAGRQTQGDALNLLGAFPRANLPRECVGIKDTVPDGFTGYQRLDYSRFGTFLGTEYQTLATGNRIASGESNFPDPNLDAVREQVLAWALPGRGFGQQAGHGTSRKGGRG